MISSNDDAGSSFSNDDGHQDLSDREKDSDELDKEKIDIIKNLMANFQLPDENYPSWAKLVPENEWQNHLTNRNK
ncbi:lupus La protein [Sarcoptes scabiei]|nr:lupus La protein [Sarcoptes scabiei]